MKEIILNADDFGLSAGANRGIIRAWQEGMLTSTSLMAGGDAFEEAAAFARANPALQVGLHLTLVQGSAVLPQQGLPALTGAAGEFTDDAVLAGMRYFFLKGLRKKLRLEIDAQLARCRDAGVELSHVDGHLNIHMHPVVFDILCELMPAYGIKSFRLTRENLRANLALDRTRVVGKCADAFIFARLAERCRPRLQRLGIRYAGEVKGLLNSGHMTEEYLVRALDGVGEGLTEIYFHPGCHPCSTLTRRMPDYQHEAELAALTSPRVRQKLEQAGITLRNYRGEEKTYV
ncbi:hopanoid biosynthesis-associated protein HpnK [Geomonas subterranea]|uniref:Hopanoid biosynthesis-associated protein HpnK n=1 Tax=Geomonas subterranea TaxID=2847989 RepID=A0ABX8LJ26_9BACT|nr:MULTISPECIES: hopanoid biosynthesis-associated protein HpnK [Geomonas]QXE90715.1 hopanoid biosynthesis-associated protein HpnK [Geomonas subterranea]QXM11203.1 hopanoid biosynthesis-associated protein HpnK [Geomonas subterranea]